MYTELSYADLCICTEQAFQTVLFYTVDLFQSVKIGPTALRIHPYYIQEGRPGSANFLTPNLQGFFAEKKILI